MRGRTSLAVVSVAFVLTTGIALEDRAAPELFIGPLDRTALRHVDSGERHGRIKARKRVLDPRSDEDRELDKLDARIRLLWAKVERLETELLTSYKEDRASA